MDHLTTCIEQLDLAAQQLHHDNAAYRRFALILTDNVVELMCFDRCEKEFWLEDLLRGHGKYPPGRKAEVLGSDFKGRLNFLQSIGVLTADQQTFAAAAHDYRNESYHTGIVHDDIMHALAWHHHRLACELFVALRRSYAFARGENPSPAWARHGGSEELYRGEEGAYVPVARSLHATRPSPEPSLPQALDTSIRTRLDAIQDAINYLVSDSPKKMDEAEVIRDVQYWAAYGEHYKGKTFSVHDEAALEAVRAFAAYLENEWQPKYPKTPMPGWIRRTARLRQTLNVANALQNFASLRREIEPFGEMVFSSANSLGAHIDEQIDRAKEDAAFGRD